LQKLIELIVRISGVSGLAQVINQLHKLRIGYVKNKRITQHCQIRQAVQALAWNVALAKVCVNFSLKGTQLDTFGHEFLINGLTSLVAIFRRWLRVPYPSLVKGEFRMDTISDISKPRNQVHPELAI